MRWNGDPIEEEANELRRQLHATEAQRDLLISEMQDLRNSLTDERIRAAKMKDTIDGLITDLSLMESNIREITMPPSDD